MRGGPRGFRPGFPCPAVLRNSSRKAARFRLRDCYPLWFDVPVDSTNAQLCNFPTRRQTDQDEPYNPCTTTTAVYHIAQVWAESLFARHYSGSRGFFPFLRVLRCFSSPACLFLPYVFRQEYARITTRRFPHSDIPGSKVGQHLPRAFRSRPRPSSALGAKASTVCSCSLDSKEHVFTAAMEFSRCARASTSPREDASSGRSLKTQQRRRRARRSSRRVAAPDGPKAITGTTPTGVIAPVFPRKEVIQPQLPLRLPCYDFTPIINPTFDGCLLRKG